MNKKPIPEIILERYLLNDLDEKRMREIEDMIAADGNLRRRVDDMKESGEEILSRYPSEMMVPLIMKKSGRSQVSGQISSSKKKSARLEMLSKKLVPALALASVAAGVTFYALISYLPGDRVVPGAASEVTRAKGLVPGLYVYRKKGGTIEVLKPGTAAGARDLVQIAYMTVDHDHGLIFSIDGNGAVILQYPDDPGSSTRISTGKKVFLQTSYELDDAPDFEKFYFITSPREIDVDMVLKKAQKVARKAVTDNADFTRPGAGQRQYVFTLKKKELK